MDGVPARYLPNELQGTSRENMEMIDLSLLRRRTDSEYLVDTGDVLGVYIEGVLGQRDVPPINQPLDTSRPPTIGFPLTIRDDGTLSLPLIPALIVRGKSIGQIEQDVRTAYTLHRKLLRPGMDRILISLHQPRIYRVLVVRQEAVSDQLVGSQISTNTLGNSKRGTGKIVALQGGKNDVLHALVESGGLPGLDAENVVYVIRPPRAPRAQAQAVSMNPIFPGYPNGAGAPMAPQTFGPGAPPGFNPGVYAPPQPQPVLPMSFPVPVPSTGSPMLGSPVQPGGRGPEPAVSRGPIPQAPINYPIIRGQSPNSMSPGPGYSSPSDAPSGIQQTNYLMATPKQVAEHITGIPMPPRAPDSPGLFSGGGLRSLMPGSGSASASARASGIQQASHEDGMTANIPPQGATMPSGGWQPPQAWNNLDQIPALCQGGNVTRIPLRLTGNESLNITPQDVILEDGDIVFIGSRDDEVFYTAGLLGGGEYSLPRDRDIDVLEAIAIAESRAPGAQSGRSALNSDVTISPSQAIVLRKLPNGSQVPVLVDLYRARRHESERILIQPGDYIILQYTKCEAIGAFVERHILASALLGITATQLNRQL